ncbi:MAG: thiol reductant ABC exporter subunit CydD, partial [Eggerthellaceae bacterium]|nr:thiol reductant ABC exporter subunit CydD [Eggerthellaceae bacterium]
YLFAVFLGCFIGSAILQYLIDGFVQKFAHTTANDLRNSLLESIFASKAHAAQDNGTAFVTSAVLEGIEQTEEYLTLVLPRMIHMVIVPVLILIVAFTFDAITGVILLIMYPVIIAYMILLGNLAKSRAEKQYGTYKRMENNFIDTLRGIDTLEAFGRTYDQSKEIFSTSEKFRVATIETIKLGTLSSAVLDLITTASIGAVSLMLAMHILDMKFGLFIGLTLLILSPEYFKPIREFASDFHASLNGKNAMKAITQIVDESKSQQQDIDTVIKPFTHESTIALNNISFAYSQAFHVNVEEKESLNNQEYEKQDEQTNAPQALSDISFNVTGFKKIGIVGTSGCGKSTLIKLLAGFIRPSSGGIAIDGNEYSHSDIASWQQQIHFIPQDPYIFQASLRDNIAFYAPNATNEDIDHAVRIVDLTNLVETLPYGVDTIIGEQGRGLSGGQAQRIALARAFLDAKRSVLIFDEPTAHLDIETELSLKEKMLPLMEDRLVFFATHRLHWLKEMDTIIVLDKGRIAESGTFDELIANKGALFNFVKTLQGGDQ